MYNASESERERARETHILFLWLYPTKMVNYDRLTTRWMWENIIQP